MVHLLQPNDGTPLYMQIEEELRRGMATGRLAVGEMLPSSRQLARDLGVSRITVTNAYADLEAEGLIQSCAGRGTFVLPAWRGADASEDDTSVPGIPVWQQRLPCPPDPSRDEMMRQTLRGWGSELIAGFGWGAGDARLFPADEFRKILAEVLRADGAVALAPEFPEGYHPLRKVLAHYLYQLGIDVTADELVITAGTQQTIDLVARTILEPGDRVVVEAPTWPGAFEAFASRGATVVGVPLDADGMRTDVLRQVLAREEPRLIYTVPTFHNPTGSVMNAGRRRELLLLAHQYGVPILEDDHVREVRFGSPIPPPLAALDRHGEVIYAASFTKSVIPALRLGYVVARGPFRERLIACRRSIDLFGSALLQRAAWRYMESGDIVSHWKRISRVYRRRHAAMLAALRRHFPRRTSWTGTEGGLVLWVRVPESISVSDLLADALRAGVSFAPGAAFFPCPADQPFMRLNFASLTETQIERGVSILGQLLTSRLTERQR